MLDSNREVQQHVADIHIFLLITVQQSTVQLVYIFDGPWKECAERYQNTNK